MSDDNLEDIARLAAIGRAVVAHLKPGDPIALRHANAAVVVVQIKHIEERLRSLENCRALHVGRLVLDVQRALTADDE